MGFLKELFEKKLKASTSMASRDLYGDSEVARSAQSEWALPQLRPQKTMNPGEGKDLSGTEWDEPAAAGCDSVCYLQAQTSAKSFSFAAQRKQQLEHVERVQAAQQASLQPAPQVKYDNINQFSQKVELYRGSVATVLKGVCITTNSKVIIKAYYKQKMHPKHYHKLQREIDAMKALNGPYVAEFFSTFEDPQCIYIIMEFCEGGDLFKTMLMHGGLLDEQWVCIEVITPLLRILEKMHSMKLLHRDIKPENIFLTGLGKFKLGDFGLAIKFDKELPFSRSGTLDYMAPEVLKNPSVPFQESKSIDLAMLTSRGVKPYGPPVDVWAAGVLAYELVCGRPPFEVEDEAQTAALIMYSDTIKFPPNRSTQWSDFVKSALIKAPDLRPTATALLKHPWIVNNLQRTLTERNRPSKEMLLQPLPLDLAHAYAKGLNRTLSSAAATGSSGTSLGTEAPSTLPALPTGGLPASGLTLPAAFPATPTGATRNMQHLHMGFGGREASGPASSSSNAGTSTSRLSGLSPSHQSAPGSLSNAGSSGHSLEQLQNIQTSVGDFKRPEAAAGLTVSLPSPKVSLTGSTGHHLSHLNPAASSSSATVTAAAAAGSSPVSPGQRSPPRTSAAAAPLKPALGLGLKVTLPPETEFEICGSSDSFCYSPTTPAPKPGIKERMKFYFQRQAGGAGGF